MARQQGFDTAEVLYKALGAFWSKGYEATSLSDLTRIMGLSKSSLYGAFGDKRQLFLAAFDLYRRDRAVELREILAAGCARAAIERYFRLIVTDAGKETFSNGCMSINQAVELAPHDPEVRARVQADFELIEEELTSTIKRGQAEGSVKSLDAARKLARLQMVSFPGLQVMVRTGMSQEWLDEAIEELLSLLDQEPNLSTSDLRFGFANSSR
ncbi:TetR/AcrR family transcriptional regulator [Sphingobium sp. CECT 9361]|uniref:TetR/AcrR family transcriptional regulator n=1 Tax=Sphingobium sp. CECT 9361 TaxID=2845384 RepID=UPI001E41ADE5|nr:TetR/AcrR family transcriptional regulator [Sphingobium sp. CECT 9361]CAH0354224.1 HTH-type transcriptional repressor ComR [Sphingobium sp. CECT 9361]